MKAYYCFLIFLLILNLVCLYLVIDLAGYGEMINYLNDGNKGFRSPRQISFIFFFTCMVNLLFISAVLMKSIIFSDKNKNTRF